ncbi:MAG: C40 family peptidase [Chitinophagaceae bacterium]
MSNVSKLHVMLNYAICSVSVASLRVAPAHTSEQCSQLLFGERISVLDFNEETAWARVRCDWDSYEGWCKMGQIQPIKSQRFGSKIRTFSSTQNGALLQDEQALWLPAGCELDALRDAASFPQLSLFQGKFKGKKNRLDKIETSEELLLQSAFSFRNAPYQWGGRSLAGIDCSGFTQMAFKLCGIPIPRDASAQAKVGQDVHFLIEAKAGDLAFFDNDLGIITHVGMILDTETILHATDTAGRVVVDKIDPAGIISRSLKMRTHRLRLIRRVMQ